MRGRVVDERGRRYLTGVHAPVDDELDVGDLAVTGSLPPELTGAYLRNGPNPVFAPRGRYHLFDGDGMVHAVSLSGGRASYRNRWVRSRGLEAELRAGEALYGGMANADLAGPEGVGDAGPVKNVANTNVVRHAGRILCLWEAGPPTEIDRDLATRGELDFDGRLVGGLTAHPKLDPETGEMLAFGYSAIPPYLRHHVVDPSGALVRTVDVDLPAPVMIHDSAITERYAVFLDAPAVFDLHAFTRGEPMVQWRPERGARIGVLPRDATTDVTTWLDVEPCYVFHFLNGYDEGERGERIVLDACRLPRMDIGLGDDADPGDGVGHLTRFTLDLAAARVHTERLGELPGDFPRIAPSREGRRHRYGYVASVSGATDGGHFDCVVKHDHESGEIRVHRFGPGQVTGEAVFAPAPGGTNEDDGWLLSIVSDEAGTASDLVVLDAPSMTEVARVHLPRRVPFGFHGNWLPEGHPDGDQRPRNTGSRRSA